MATDYVTANVALVKSVMPEVEITQVTESLRKVKKILVLGFKGSPNFVEEKNVVVDGLAQNNRRILNFEPTKEEAWRCFKKFPQDYPIVLFDKEDLKWEGQKMQIGEQYKVLVTHSLGNLGKAINMPEFSSVFVDARIFKPLITQKISSETTEESIKQSF